MRKPGRISLALFAGLALTVGLSPAASADPPTSGGTWTGVEVDSVGGCDPADPLGPGYCETVATSTASILLHPNGSTISNCNVELAVRVYPDGYTLITAVDVTGDAPCGDIEAQNLPWEDQFCAFDPDDPTLPVQYWDQIKADFVSPLGSVTGRIYALLNSAGTALNVDSAIYGSTTPPTPPFRLRANGSGGSAPYGLDDAIGISKTEDDCAWTVFP